MSACLLIAVGWLTAAEPSSSADPQPMEIDSAIELTYRPQQRELGISRLQSWLREHPEDRRAQHALARALAWSGRHDDALAHYDALLELEHDENRSELVRERLEVLAWKGNTREAVRGYRGLLEEDPDDAEARLGLARTLRWTGRPLAGRWHARKAMKIQPDDARHELAYTHAILGQPGAARRILDGGEPTDELASRLRLLEAPRVGTSLSGAGNSFDIQRVALRSAIRVPLPYDFGVEIGTGVTHLRQGETQMSHGVAGLAITATIDRLELRGGAGAYGAASHHGLDGHARASVRVVDELHVSVGYRHRPLLENTTPEDTGEATYHGAGVGPVQVLDSARDTELDQVTASINVVPRSWGYVYADGGYMWVDDGNRGFTVSTGAGADLLGRWKHWPVRLYARWDIYMAGFDEARTAYFAPDFLDVHSVGLDLRVRVWELELAGNGGGTFPLFAQASSGYYCGGALMLGTERVSAGLRADYRADAFFQQWRAWFAIEVLL